MYLICSMEKVINGILLICINSKQNTTASVSLFIVTNYISGFIAHTITTDIDLDLIINLSIVVMKVGLMGCGLAAITFVH